MIHSLYTCLTLSKKQFFWGLFFVFYANVSLIAQTWKYNALKNQNQLSKGITGGEGGQWPQALAVSANGNLIMAGLDVAGIIRSETSGDIWQQANAGYTPRGNCAIVIDPNNINRVLAVGGNSSLELAGEDYHGIYLSTDKGASWHLKLPADLCGFRDIREQLAWDKSSYKADIGGSSIAYWSRSDSTYCQNSNSAGEPGLYKTTDGGMEWVRIPNSENFGQSIVKVHPKTGFIYIANKNGFYRSTNGGISFTLQVSGNITGMDVVESQLNCVYISKANVLMRSDDLGVNFTTIAATNFPANAAFIKVSPANPNRMMVQRLISKFNTPWYYSHDGGITWNETLRDTSLDYLPYNSGRLMYPVWHPLDQNVVWCVGGDWVTKSTDGGRSLQWNNNGSSLICQTGYFAFSLQSANTLVVTTQDYSASITSNGGTSWNYLGKPLSKVNYGGFAYGGYALNADTIFIRKAIASRGATTIAISYDAGNTFIDKGEVQGEMCGYNAPTNPSVYFLGNKRSEDRGASWSTMLGCTGVFTHNVANPSEIFGVDNNTKSLVGSTDAGATWTEITKVPDFIRDIGYDHVKDIFYIVTEFGFFQYSRTSAVLTTITSRVPADQLNRPRQFRTVAVDPVNTDIVYVGNRRDLYASDVSICRSVDGAKSFISLTQSPKNGNVIGLDAGREVQCIRVHPITREAWVGCATYGLWKIPAPDEATFSLVKWGALEAVKSGQDVNISWETSGPFNGMGFEVQKSNNKIDFVKIAEVKAAAGNSESEVHTYDYKAENLISKNMSFSIFSVIVMVLLLGLWHNRRRIASITILLCIFFGFCFSCRKMETSVTENNSTYIRIAAVGYQGYKSYSSTIEVK